MKFSAEKLAAAAARRRRAEAALDAATEGALGASQEAPSKSAVQFLQRGFVPARADPQ